MKKRYKILYLPTGEYVVISKEIDSNYISRPYSTGRSFYGFSLSAPRSILDKKESINCTSLYQDVIFTNKRIIQSWLTELIERDSCKKYNLRLEHFEIMEIQ